MKCKFIIPCLIIISSLFVSTSVYSKQSIYSDNEGKVVDVVDVNSLINARIKGSTYYEFRTDIDLGGRIIEIADGSVLSFIGGSIRNGELKGSFYISAPSYRIFDSVKFIPSQDILVEWIGINTFSNHNSDILNWFISSLPENQSANFIFSSTGIYAFYSSIFLRTGLSFCGAKGGIMYEHHYGNPVYGITTLKFIGDFYGFVKNNEYCLNRFSNLCLMGENGAGGIDLRDSKESYGLHLENVVFYGFKTKCGIILSNSWNVHMNNCVFDGCGCAIYFCNSAKAVCNNITLSHIRVENCALGLFSNMGQMWDINIFGGAIQDVNIGKKSTMLPVDIDVKGALLQRLKINNRNELSGAIIFNGGALLNIIGCYFEGNANHIILGENSALSLLGCYFNSVINDLNPEYIINIEKGVWAKIEGCVFTIPTTANKLIVIKRNMEYSIKGNSYYSRSGKYRGNIVSYE